MTIRAATENDIPALLEIHNDAVRRLSWIWISREDTLADRTKWFHERMAAGFPVLVAEDGTGRVIGYGAFGTYRGRDGYDLTVEHSVYLLPEAQGHGLGKRLLTELIDIARAQGRHMMVAVIDTDNVLSIKLHEKFGFVHAGTLPEAGKKHGRWVSQTNMYLLLDDRKAPPAA